MSSSTNASRTVRQLRSENRRSLPPATKARNQLVLNHLGLAHLAAKRQMGRGRGEREDLLQEAHLGLIRGCEGFDPGRGLKVSTYALTMATGQIKHYRRDRERCIRIPWRLADLHAKAAKQLELRARTQLPPLSDHALAACLGVSTDRWDQARQAHVRSQVVSLDQPAHGAIGENAGERSGPLIEQLSDTALADDGDPQLEWLANALQTLSPQRRTLVLQHHVEGLSATAIAARQGTGVRAVRSELRSALHILKTLAAQQNQTQTGQPVLSSAPVGDAPMPWPERQPPRSAAH